MLSYRHSFHAGNHADVLKHIIFVQLLQYMGQKDKPFWVIDTHAGAGRYALSSEQANKLEEYKEGIARLWDRKDLPALVEAYVAAVRADNPGGRLRYYPGSPRLAQQLLREQDKLRLFELHSTDHQILADNIIDQGKQTILYADDGFANLKALLPPASRRGLVLIDPSYELREDYGRAAHTIKEAMLKFPTGTYAVWYPIVPKVEAVQFPKRLKAAAGEANWVHATLSVHKASTQGFGMCGSGMFIINPPWTLNQALQDTLPWLRDALAQDEHASFTLEAQSK